MKTKKLNKIQVREVTVREYEDGTYNLEGSLWNLDNLNPEEIEEAFLAWKQKQLKEKCSLNIKSPKILSN